MRRLTRKQQWLDDAEKAKAVGQQMPPTDGKGARYDWCSPDDRNIYPAALHSINCNCNECCEMDNDD